MRILNPRTLVFVLAALVLVQIGVIAGQLTGAGRAWADPIGMSVSGGANPLVTLTNLTTNIGNGGTLYTVPTGRIFVITDIHIDSYHRPVDGHYDVFRIYDQNNRYWWSGNWGNQGSTTYPQYVAQSNFSTGMAVPAGTVLKLGYINGHNGVYTITGYLARP